MYKHTESLLFAFMKLRSKIEMIIGNRQKIDDITVLKMSELSDINIDKAILDAVKGRIIVTNSEGMLIGSYSVEHTQKGVDSIRGIPVVVEGKESLEVQVKKLLEINDWHGLIPIIDSAKCVKGAFTCVPDKYEKQILEQLPYLAFLYEKNIDMGYYFHKKGIKRIAFWGLNNLALTFANFIRKSEYVSVCGIYENAKNRQYIGGVLII